MGDTKNVALVVDNGSGMCKAGVAGAVKPYVAFPSLVGHLRHGLVDITGVSKTESCYVGNNAREMRHILTLQYPIERGIIENWDDMERIWHHLFYNELQMDPEKHPVLLAQAPTKLKANRVKIAEIMFETFGIPALYIAPPTVLSLYATGRTTGLAVDAGDGGIIVEPIYEGYALSRDVVRQDMGGRDLTTYLVELLKARGYMFNTTAEHDIVRNIKENMCYVSEGIDESFMFASKYGVPVPTTSAYDKLYELPDGQIINVGKERFLCPEALFHPTVMGLQYKGVHHLVYNTIKKCEIDCRKRLYKNVIVSGGTTMFPGFIERMYHELNRLVPAAIEPRIFASSLRNFTSWLGGSILASHTAFKSNWVLKEDYNEAGQGAFTRKISP